MFGAKAQVRDYLRVIAPWCNEWRQSDFADEKVIADRMNPTAYVFLLPTRPWPGLLEGTLLGPRARAALVNLLGCVSRFNQAAERYNNAPIETRMAECISLHAGVIGHRGSNMLFDAFKQAEREME